MLTKFAGRRVARFAIAGGLIAALILPGVALADTVTIPNIAPRASRDATITVGSVRLMTKAMVIVPVSFVCMPFDTYDWNTGQTIQTTEGSIEFSQVVILQASGRKVAWGEAAFYGPATCDGSTVNRFDIPVSAQSLAFAKGKAVVGAQVFIADRASFQDSDAASSGPLTVKVAV